MLDTDEPLDAIGIAKAFAARACALLWPTTGVEPYHRRRQKHGNA